MPQIKSKIEIIGNFQTSDSDKNKSVNNSTF